MGKAGRGRAATEGQADPAAVPLDRLAEDWITLWQTELAGLAADPDWIALTQQGLAIGAGWMRLMAAAASRPWPGAAPAAEEQAPPRRDAEAGRDGAAGPAPAAAAPGDGGAAGLGGAGDGGDGHGAAAAEAEALRQRLAELERRLAALERGPGRGRTDRPGTRRRRPPA